MHQDVSMRGFEIGATIAFGGYYFNKPADSVSVLASFYDRSGNQVGSTVTWSNTASLNPVSAWYTFEADGLGWLEDKSGQGNHLTFVSGNPAIRAASPSGGDTSTFLGLGSAVAQGWEDAGSGLTIPLTFPVSSTTGFTFQCSIYPGEGSGQTLLQAYDSSTDSFQLYLTAVSKLRISGVASGTSFTAEILVTLSDWTNIALTYDGSNSRFRLWISTGALPSTPTLEVTGVSFSIAEFASAFIMQGVSSSGWRGQVDWVTVLQQDTSVADLNVYNSAVRLNTLGTANLGWTAFETTATLTVDTVTARIEIAATDDDSSGETDVGVDALYIKCVPE
jgi:hypothetical protein